MVKSPTNTETTLDNNENLELRSKLDELRGSIKTLGVLALALLVTIVGGFWYFSQEIARQTQAAVDRIERAGEGECSIFGTLWEFNTVGAGKTNGTRLGTIALTENDAPGDHYMTAGYYHPNEQWWRYENDSIFLAGPNGMNREYVKVDLPGIVYRWDNPESDIGTELILLYPTRCTSLTAVN